MITFEEKENALLDFTLDMYSIPHIPRNSVQTIIEKVKTLLFKINYPYVEQKIQNKIKNYCPKDICGSVHTIFEEEKQSFKNVETEYLRFQEYKKKDLL